MDVRLVLSLLLVVAISNASKKHTVARKKVQKPELVIPEGQHGVLADLVDANNQFTVDLLKKLKGDAKGNVLFAPGSLGTALSMTLLGTAGETAKELGKALHWADKSKDETFSAYHQAMRGFLARVKTMNSDVKNKFEIVNRIWLQKDFPVREDFVNKSMNYYFSPTLNVNFGEPVAATERINGWVKNKTRNKIKKIIPDGAIDSTTKFVLTNALYFKGTWEIEFNKTLTSTQKFHYSATSSKLVQMMQTRGRFAFSSGRHCKYMSVVELPYKDSNFSMLIILPDKRKEEKAEKQLVWTKLKRCFSSLPKLRTREVILSMPRFKVRGNYPMKDVLRQLDVQSMFTPGVANFAGIVDPPRHKNLYVDEVFHQAFLKVNEVGAEAASASASVIKERSMIFPIKFYVDRPFYFTILERSTNAMFFFGKVSKP